MMRQERDSKTVLYSEYLKMKGKKDGFIVVFEGKECPSVYKNWFRYLNFNRIVGQIISRGKRKLLELRELIKKNFPKDNDVIFFSDKDYDSHPGKSTFPEVYITNGYSIENDIIQWEYIRNYIESYFDIANNDDNISLEEIRNVYEHLFEQYKGASREVHKLVYLCRINVISCFPGESIFDFIEFDKNNLTFNKKYSSITELFETLKIEEDKRAFLSKELENDDSFSKLNPLSDWRGKFHFSFLKKFMSYAKDLRVSGEPPFRRAVKINIDPAQPSLMGNIAAFSNPPMCLSTFINMQTGR